MEPRRRGGQPGNKNAVGNKGGAPIGNRNAAGHGAPLGNKNAVKHGLYESIILPTPLHRLVVRIIERNGMEPTLANFYKVRAQLVEECFPGMQPYFRR